MSDRVIRFIEQWPPGHRLADAARAAVLLLGRRVPGLRTVNSLPAGVSRLPPRMARFKAAE